MHAYARRLAATLAVMTLLLTTSSAAANRLSVNVDTFRIIWNTMSFTTAAGTTIRCKVTLQGSFTSRVIAKTLGATMGEITAASIAECSGGRMVFLTETLPWTILYRGYVSALPNITAVLVTMSGISFRWGTISTCLYSVPAETPLIFGCVRTPETTQIVLVNPEPTAIPSTSWLCETEPIRLGGTPGAMTLASNFEGVFVRLF